MKSLARRTACLAAAVPLVLAGCGGAEKPPAQGTPPAAPRAAAKAPAPEAKPAPPADDKAAEEAALADNLAKLSPEDRKLAEAQRFCAVQDEDRLGSMGTPLKLMIKGQPVFLCCKGCRKQALADPDATLAKVEELKKKAAPAKK
jgi:hypothetical protein